ncbi:MAG: hypothetical protein V4519_05365 [Patescibacteria group bacterium]
MSEMPFNERLIPSGLGDTPQHLEELLQLENHPNKIIRIYPLDVVEQTYHMPAEEALKNGKRLFEELNTNYNISTKADFVIGKDKEDRKVVYIITDRIEGESLHHIVDKSESDEIKKIEGDVHNMYISLIKYYTDKIQSGDYFLDDIAILHQYVYGKKTGELEEKIYMVDTDISFNKDKASIYEAVWELTRQMKRFEKRLNTKFDDVRNMIKEFLNVHYVINSNDRPENEIMEDIEESRRKIESMLSR